MKTLLLLPLLLVFISPGQNPTAPEEASAVTVLGFKCSKTRVTVKTPDPSVAVTPAPAMIAANRNFPRNARVNDPAGVRDPNQDTLDGRGAALEKMVQESRTPEAKPVDNYSYLVKVQNASKQIIEILFWEYQFIDPANPANVTRRQFLCGVNIKPAKEKELQAFSLSGPSDVVTVGNLTNASGNMFQEKVVINRVEYADGSTWQRKGWNAAEIKLTYQRAIASPWDRGEMCRGL